MKGLLDWFADNHIAANILMAFLLVGGLSAYVSLDKETFPPIEEDIVRVTVAYPGASPREVEQQICIRIEESLEGLQGIQELRCSATQGSGTVEVEVANNYSIDSMLNSVKSRVDSILTFPVEAERPIVQEVRFQQTTISIALYGDVDEASLKEYAESMKEELSVNPQIPLVTVRGTRRYEVSIEVPEARLREYDLSLSEVADAIAAHSQTVAGGLIRAPSGDIQVQVREQAYNARDFGNIPVISEDNGGDVRLEDIAIIRDGFVKEEKISRFNGKRAAFLDITTTQNPDILVTAREVRDFIERKQVELPDSIQITTWNDSSRYFKDRLNTLMRNGAIGLVLVMLLLLLFLRPAIAFWTAVGIAVSFVGTLFLMPVVGASINMITLFAFILVLGIVVDDAIIIGENIHRVHSRRGIYGIAGSKLGANEVAKPVVFAVTTSIVVFIPLFFLPGDFAVFMGPIATIPILALALSLVESLLILPSHLSYLKPERPQHLKSRLQRATQYIARSIEHFVVCYYRPFLRKCLNYRMLTISVFFSIFWLVFSLYAGGWVKSAMMPNVPVETIRTSVTLPAGTPFTEIENISERISKAAYEAEAELQMENNEKLIEEFFVTASGNFIETIAQLTSPEVRVTPSAAFVSAWEKHIGDLPQAERFNVAGSIAFGGEADIEFQLNALDLDNLQDAADWVKEKLGSYPGIYNLRDTLTQGRPEMVVEPTAVADNLGITPALLGQQMRQVFYGEEVQRIPRLREDVKVMVRYPDEERNNPQTLRDLRVRLPDGRAVPFDSVANTRFVEGFAEINRVDGMTTISVTADYEDQGNQTSSFVVDAFLNNQIGEFQSRFPDVQLSLEGAQRENMEFMQSIIRFGSLAILVIYGLLAIEFRSWWQPVIILAAIPFGFTGAVISHLLTGQTISMLTLMGVLAAAGVVVNDTLVLIDRANNLRDIGFSRHHALIQAGRDRFRPIFLTTMTTFVGLTPLMMEQSTQAQFLIPMASALAFGVMAASVVTLIMTPCVYSLGDDIRLGMKAGMDRLFANNVARDR